MKRVGVLMAVLAISMILIINPSPYIDSCTRGNEHQEAPFLTAADGAESSESITSFSETLADDILHYSDTLHNETEMIASSGASGDKATGGVGSISNTYTVNGQMWGNSTTEGVGWVRLNFTAPTGYTVDGWSWGLYAWGQVGDEFSNYSVYNWETDTWDYQGDLNLYGSEDWTNGTTYNSAHWQDNECAIILESEDLDSAQVGMVFVDCGVVEFYYMTLADSDHYAESFSSVSDWQIQTGNTITTNGDIGSFHIDGDSAWDYYYTNAPNLANMLGYYVEYRFSANVSGSTLRVYGFALDDHAGTAYALDGGANLFPITTAQTKRFYIPHNVALESIRIHLIAPSEDTEVKFDYFRIGPADEMGWQHDGSTTAGVTDDGNAGYDYQYTSDGDILSVTIESVSGGSDVGNVTILYDTTNTSIDIERDYYQFLEVRYRVLTFSGPFYIGGIPNLDGYKSILGTDGIYGIGTSYWETYRMNLLAMSTASTSKGFQILVGTFLSGQSVTIEIDYIKAYSIANFTVVQHASVTTAEVVYVNDDNALVFDKATSNYITVAYNPALTVNTATYNVWNITTPDIDSRGDAGYTNNFQTYVGGWENHFDESRGTYSSGTLIAFRIVNYGDTTISAIKFIEDGTAPAVVRSSSTPNDPEDDESTTLSAVITDTVEVYSVAFNAIVYPTGFSDVDYSANEQADNLWNYTFSSLDAGYYCFKIIASDGANTNALTEYAYIEITVREATIEISTYTFFGASSDFTYMQYSGHISHDCTYNISEWSTTWAKNETHTGSVTEGMFNIAWDKIGVDDAEANFTIVFVSGTLSLTIDGYYGTAYKALQVTEIDFSDLEQSDNWATNLSINFYTNKEVDWTVYDRDNADAVLHSGTTTEGDGFITWVKNTARGAHRFAVKWTDGISIQFYNNSYWVYERNIDDLPGGADPGADQRRTIEFWATIGGIAGILGIMVIGLSHYNLDEKVKNLPNYRTQG